MVVCETPSLNLPDIHSHAGHPAVVLLIEWLVVARSDGLGLSR